ncbi:MAG: diguanylate cyclase [Lachnospiraceae bacterium]|nr:diguanylate cyclase [Lachnospiraceae bacterium]
MLTNDYSRIKSYVSLDDSWEVTINGETFYGVSLEDFRFPSVKKGDRITMQRQLPQEWELVEGTLRLSIRHCAARVYIEGNLVYEYGFDRLAQNKTVGSGFQFINFPKEYAGRMLRLEFYVSEDKVFSRLDSVRIYEWQNAYRVVMTENRLPWFLGSFLFVFGLVGCVITVFALVISRKYIRLLCVSCFSICMGLWTLCYYRVIAIYSIPLYLVSLIEHITLYLAPLPLIIYMRDDVKALRNKGFYLIYCVILYGDIAALTVAVTLHAKDVVHMAAMLLYMVVFMLACLAYFLVVIVMNLKRNKTSNRLYLAGMLIIVFGTVYDIISYNRERYYGKTDMAVIKGATPISFMVFIFILILSFYIDLTQKLMREAERNSLIKSAYTDELTQLHNRRYCMEYMNRLREEHVSDYTIICFDLNNLKTVNDTYGHAKGDILIRSAADVLAQTFGEYGVVARMGGDEFICILDTVQKEKIAGLMEKFQANIEEKNRQVEGLNMSIACGCASGEKGGGDIEKVYQNADDRMYEHKKQMKEKAAASL